VRVPLYSKVLIDNLRIGIMNDKYQDYQKVLALRDLMITDVLSNELGLHISKLMWWLRTQHRLDRNNVILVLELLQKSDRVVVEGNLFYLNPHIAEIKAPHSIINFRS
jgi:Tfp pilus assembly protein PilZ